MKPKKENNAIDDYVSQIMDNDDYSQLADIIERSVETAIKVTATGAKAVVKGVRNSMDREPSRIPVNENPKYVKQNNTSATGYAILRNLTLVLTGVFSISGVGFLIGAFDIDSTIMMGLLTAATLPPASFFHKQMHLMRKFARIRREIGDNRVVSTLDFSTALNLPKAEVVQILKTLIDKDYFPQGRVVEQGELFLLDQMAYAAYKESYRPTIVVDEVRTPIEKAQPEPEASDRLALLEDYKEQLSLLLTHVKVPSFEQKVRRLYALLETIENAVKKDPAQVEQLNKFVDYYTPTALKLIQRHTEISRSSVKVSNMEKSMKDIEKAIGTIIEGYEKLLDDLYQNDLLELGAEMEVIKTVMTQDGLLNAKEENFD
ncbi:MAG: 5-bromo-4-chloroindolyl phosphate hydrolysis family protein [Tissierellia bacterium]|nr:5-bromo-4-chloroindolyl phosphate hydrolysis family protein [Tissierellia bacterium]